MNNSFRLISFINFSKILDEEIGSSRELKQRTYESKGKTYARKIATQSDWSCKGWRSILKAWNQPKGNIGRGGIEIRSA